MIPWQHLATASVPDGGGELSLHMRAGTAKGGSDEYEIRIGIRQLMNSRAFGSEEMLAELGCAHLRGKSDARVLVGGLGMGFTLERTLDYVPSSATVVVAELVPAVIEWNRGPLGPLAGNPLQDRRVEVHEGDVRDVISSVRGSFDAILLDVDNGPEGLTHKGNDWLYSRAGLKASRTALADGGILAVWSSGRERRFTERLRESAFQVEEHEVRARRTKGPRHVVWLAERTRR